MQKILLKNSWILLMVFAAFFTACNKEDNALDVQDIQSEEAVAEYTDQAVFRIQESSNTGKFGCYEFVFPITVNFEDGSSLTADSYEDLKEGIKAWKEANPDSQSRPSLEFPLEVTSDEGELITVADSEELRELRIECRKENFTKRGFKGCRGKGEKCFDIVYPVSIAFPDGTTAEAADRKEVKTLAREWKANNPDAEDRPTLVFPIDVVMEDGSTVTVDSVEDLKALKDTCSEEE